MQARDDTMGGGWEEEGDCQRHTQLNLKEETCWKVVATGGWARKTRKAGRPPQGLRQQRHRSPLGLGATSSGRRAHRGGRGASLMPPRGRRLRHFAQQQ